MSFSLSAVPPAVILALGQAFGVKNPEDMDAAAHYDTALNHLMLYWSGDTIDADSSVPRLALVMKHVALLMGPSATMPAALTKAVTNPKSDVVPPETPPPVEEKRRFTPDGFVILEFRPGEMLTTEQARERAGVSKKGLAKLLQEHEFVQPAGVVFPNGEGKARIKVYYAVDVDRFAAMQAAKKEGNKRVVTEEQRAHMAMARAANDSLPLVNPQVLKDGSYMTYDQVVEAVGCSRSHVTAMQNRGVFPKPTAKTKRDGAPIPLSLFGTAEVMKWIETSHELSAFAARKRRAARITGHAHGTGNGAADDSATEGEEPAAIAAGTFRDGAGGGDAQRGGDEVPAEAHASSKPAALAAANKTPHGWMSLREVAAYLDTTETGVERMIRQKEFPQAHRQGSKLRTKEWAARQVVKWRQEHQQEKA